MHPKITILMLVKTIFSLPTNQNDLVQENLVNLHNNLSDKPEPNNLNRKTSIDESPLIIPSIQNSNPIPSEITQTLTTETHDISNSTDNSAQSPQSPQPIQVQWLPLAIFFLVLFALCYWLCCNSKLCCDCPDLNHRSQDNHRYGRPVRKDRFQATSGYPYEPNVDPHQKYCGPNRLHRYKEPVIAIVDENDKILEDTYTLTNSYLNTADSKDEMRMFKFDLEEKRRLHQQRTDMINSLSRTRQMSAISESKEPVPVYKSQENVFKMWQTGGVGNIQEDAWSIHAPSISFEEKSSSSKEVMERSISLSRKNSGCEEKESFLESQSGSRSNNQNEDDRIEDARIEDVAVEDSTIQDAINITDIEVKETKNHQEIIEKLDEQIVVVPYEQIKNEKTKIGRIA